jgi:hypothetical protein
MISKKLLSLFLAVILSVTLMAQETTSEIQGVVSDGKNLIAGAIVTAIHTPSGTKYVTTSRKDGRFNLPNVKIGGPYEISVSFVGFKVEKQSNIFLSLGQDYKADFALQTEAKVLNEVIVTTKGKQDKVFNSNHTGSQEVITREQLDRLPTTNRALSDFTKLTPTANGLAFGGQSNQYNNVTIDGANFNNSFGLASTLGGQTNSQPVSLDALEQIQVNVSPYDVKNGQFAGAGINTVTKSGTNKFQGSVYQFFKGENSLGYKVGDIELAKQTFDYTLKGATLGGALIKNKLFFFGSYEEEKRTDPGTTWSASTPSSPANGITVSNAKASDLDALKQFLITNYSYDPGSYQGYSYVTQSKRATVKVDWNVNDKNTFTIKYNYLKSSRQVPPSNSGSVNSSNGRSPGTNAMPFYGAGYVINNDFNIVIAELNTRFSNRASNKIQIGYTALRDYRSALSGGDFPLVDILDGNGNPFTSFGYEQYTYGNKLNTDVFQFNDIFTMYKGSHEITFGTQNSFKKYLNGFSPSYEGVYRFNTLADFYASAAGTKAAARYDLSYTLGSGDFPLVGPKDLEIGFFAQDKWRASNNLTVTYGVRVDIPKFYNTFLYNPIVDGLTGFINSTHLNTGTGPKTAPQFSPRAGFTWDVKGDKSIQIRGGIGLFAGPPPFVWISNQASNSGMALFGSISAGTGYIFSPDINKYRPSATATLSKSYSLNVTDPDFKFPQVLKTSLAVDKKLPNNWVLTLEGQYSSNINAAFFQNVNQPNTGVVLNNGNDMRTRYSGTAIYPIGGSGAASINNPSIGNAIYMTNVKNGGMALNLTAQVQKTMKNFFASLAYNYQTATDVMVGGSTAATMWGSKPVSGDPNAPAVGLSNAYLPHRIIGTISYKKEYAKFFATSVGLLFEAAPNGTDSYIYNGDLNNDGQTSNDLMYIPKGPGEINFQNSAAVSGVVDNRSALQIWNQVDAFINNNPYLRKHRGEYAERNAAVEPWYTRVDLNVTQDIYFKTKETKHTLRITCDIYNFTNMLNRNWGVQQIPTVTNPIKFEKMAPDGKTPIFSFPFADGVNRIPYTAAYKNNVGLGSRWQMQIGVHYLFN